MLFITCCELNYQNTVDTSQHILIYRLANTRGVCTNLHVTFALMHSCCYLNKKLTPSLPCSHTVIFLMNIDSNHTDLTFKEFFT